MVRLDSKTSSVHEIESPADRKVITGSTKEEVHTIIAIVFVL